MIIYPLLLSPGENRHHISSALTMTAVLMFSLMIRPLQSSVVEAVWTVNQLHLPFFTPFLRARYFVQGPLGKRFRIPVPSLSLPA